MPDSADKQSEYAGAGQFFHSAALTAVLDCWFSVHKGSKRSQPQPHSWPARLLLIQALTFFFFLNSYCSLRVHLLLACLCQFYSVSPVWYLSLSFTSALLFALLLWCSQALKPFFLLFYFIFYLNAKLCLSFASHDLSSPGFFLLHQAVLCWLGLVFIFLACGNFGAVSAAAKPKRKIPQYKFISR